MLYTYYYAGDKLMRMTVGTDKVMDFIYDQNGRPYSVIQNGVVSYYVLNQQGDVVRIVNASGATRGEYRYDAWGNLLYITDSDFMRLNPLRYRGYVYDAETKLYYCQSRYYDPATGRFLNADAYASTGQGLLGNNMFAYCGNNPVNCYDPSGNAYQGIYSQINYSEFEHTYGGHRENFFSLPDPVKNDFRLLGDVADAGVSYLINKAVPWYGVADMFVGFWEVYDQCRYAGLDCGSSFGGAFLFTFVPNIPTKYLEDTIIVDIAVSLSADTLLDSYIEYWQPSPVEAACNRTNHIAQKRVAVCVGGSISCIAFGSLEMRDLYVG